MSYIDTGFHEHLGLLAGMPLYHPLQEYDRDFTADSRHLVLGGGSGEYHAAVFDPVFCVGSLLTEVDDIFTGAGGAPVFMDIVPSNIVPRLRALIDFMPQGDRVDFSGWTGLDWARVVKEAKRAGFRKDRETVEKWLINSVGEYALVCYTSLVQMTDYPVEHRNTLNQIRHMVATMPLYQNVSQRPKGYTDLGNLPYTKH